MSANPRKLLLIVTAVFAVALIVKLGWTPFRIQYHRNFVAAARNPLERPERLRDYISLRSLRWFLIGMPTSWQNLHDFGRKHEDALIQMGYLDRRSYSFTNSNVQAFASQVCLESLKECFMRGPRGGPLEVVAHRKDFQRIEEIYRSLEKQNESPKFFKKELQW